MKKMQEGEFEPTWESLQNYKVLNGLNAPNLVFGHIGTCVLGRSATGWRVLSIWKVREYKHHVEHYGHPSEVGFKDILPLFKSREMGSGQIGFLL